MLVYESGTIGSKPTRLPLSIGDGELADTADSVVSVPEMFNYWLQGGRIDVGFLGAAQVDRFANINTTVVDRGPGKPEGRLPGAGGAPEIAANCGQVLMVLRHSRRNFVGALDFVTTLGHGTGPRDRAELGLPGAGPTAVITDLGVLRPDPDTAELVLTDLHPGVTVEQVREATGWELKEAARLGVTAPPTAAELAALRALKAAAPDTGRYAHRRGPHSPGRKPDDHRPSRGTSTSSTPSAPPIGKYGGALSGVRPDDLAAHVVKALVDRAPGLDPARIDDVFLGNANGAGEENRDVARMAVLLAGLPVSVPGVTVNRLCGSGMEAVIQAARAVALGDASVVIAGGVESMSRAPWVLPKPERAFPAGQQTLHSTTLGWRLTNPRMPDEWTVALGEGAELVADRHGITRDQQDAYALASHEKAARAWKDGAFDAEVVPCGDGADAGGEPAAVRDECVREDTSLQALGKLRPAFRKEGGTVTAGNSSPLNDGAAALLLMDEQGLRESGLRTARPDPQQRGHRHRTAVLRTRTGRGGRTGPGEGRTRLRRPAHRRAERGVRRPGARLPRRLARPRPVPRQPARRRHRHRAPAGRLRRPDRRRGGPPAGGRGLRYGPGDAVHRRRAGARRGAGEVAVGRRARRASTRPAGTLSRVDREPGLAFAAHVPRPTARPPRPSLPADPLRFTA